MDAQRLRIYERVVFATMFAGPGLALVGIVLASGANLGESTQRMGVLIGAAGAILTGVSIGLGYPLVEFRTILRKNAAGAAYNQMRYMGHLKASSILLNFMWLLGIVGLVLALLQRSGVLALAVTPELTNRLAAVGSVVILANLSHVHYLSLRIPLPRGRRTFTTPILLVELAVTALFALFAVALTERAFSLSPTLTFESFDAPLFLLAALVFCSIDLVTARPVPNLLSIFQESKGPASARDYISKTKSILLPAVSAFGLLFLVLFLLLIVGVGTSGIRSPVQLGVFAFIALAMIASVFFSVRLARSEDVYELYRVQKSAETRTGIWILSTSLSVAALLGVLTFWLLRGHSVWVLSSDRWVDVLCVALLIATGPYGYYVQRRLRRIRHLEERFPDFLRDVAASHRGGLTLTASVQMASKGEYGELTPEIRKMADQLSWNVPFNEALAQLMERVETPLIERAITLIIEASRSGGNTTDVLLAAARDAREIKNLENERRATMGLYSVIIYITFGVFLVVAAVLYGQLVPEIIRSAEAAAGSGSDASVAGINLNIPTKGEYRAFYFLSAVVQGVGNGLVGGLFQNGKVLAGLRHAFIMVLITYVTFTFVFP